MLLHINPINHRCSLLAAPPQHGARRRQTPEDADAGRAEPCGASRGEPPRSSTGARADFETEVLAAPLGIKGLLSAPLSAHLLLFIILVRWLLFLHSAMPTESGSEGKRTQAQEGGLRKRDVCSRRATACPLARPSAAVRLKSVRSCLPRDGDTAARRSRGGSGRCRPPACPQTRWISKAKRAGSCRMGL